MKSRLNTTVLSAVFAALIFILTFSIRIPVPLGYIHFGDSMIYLAACFLPAGYAMLSGAIGGGLADLASGFYLYIAFTVIIKALITLPFTSKSSHIMTKRNVFAIFISGIITVTGYCGADFILTGDLLKALNGTLSSLIQAAGSAVIFVFVGMALDKTGLKKRVT